MNWPTTIAVVLLGTIIAFLQAVFTGTRTLLGAQIDLLPAVMVYVGLTTGLVTISLAALFGGFSFDVLSLNPLGTSTLPLLVVGLVVYRNRQLILRDQIYAQLLLGLGACALVPVMSLLVLFGLGENPLIGWGSIWQWIIMMAGGALLTPACFFLLDRVYAALSYPSITESAFRDDREIKRGR